MLLLAELQISPLMSPPCTIGGCELESLDLSKEDR